MMWSLLNLAASLKQGSLGVVTGRWPHRRDSGPRSRHPFRVDIGGEVLAEVSPGEGRIGKLGVPRGVVLGRICVDRPCWGRRGRKDRLGGRHRGWWYEHHTALDRLFEDAGFKVSPCQVSKRGRPTLTETIVMWIRDSATGQTMHISEIGGVTVLTLICALSALPIPLASYRIRGLLD